MLQRNGNNYTLYSLCTFQGANVLVVSVEPDEIIEHIEQPEIADLTEYLAPPPPPRATTTKTRRKLKKSEKRKPGPKPKPKPKEVAVKTKLKEKKVRDKNQLKEKRKQVCPICGMLVSFLPYHLEVHDPNIFYDCDICGHRAPSRTVIINHFRNKHFSKRFGVPLTHRREHCNFTSKFLFCSSEHICPHPHCALKFTQSLSLKRHLSVHSGEKNFKCECGKSYRQIDSLKAHRKRHLEPTIPCPYCVKYFYTKNELKSHVGIHTYVGYIEASMRAHEIQKIIFFSSGEKPFKCDMCAAAFVASSSLAAHRRQHKKDNILPTCKLCGIQFTDRLLLTMHMYDHKHKRWINSPETLT